MKTAFYIFKQGTTDGWVKILMPISEPFDMQAKIGKYLSLGYQVILPNEQY